jgi:WD40 repeat protein
MPVQLPLPQWVDHLTQLEGLPLGAPSSIAAAPPGSPFAWAVGLHTGLVVLHRRGASASRSVVVLRAMGSIDALAWERRGARLAGGGDDGRVFLWDPAASEEATTMGTTVGWVRSLSWSHRDKRLAVGGDDGIDILATDRGSRETFLAGQPHSWVTSVDWAADGRLSAGGIDGWLSVWKPSLDAAEQLEAHDGWVNSVAWSPDADRLASVGDDGTVRLWWSQPEDGSARWINRRIETGLQGWVNAITWSPDGAELAATGSDGTVRAFGRDSQGARIVGRHEGFGRRLAWSESGLASVGDDERVRVWDPPTADATPSEVSGSTRSIRALA